MEPIRLKRLPGLMRRGDRMGQAGKIGAKSIADATLSAAYRSLADGPRQDVTAAERAHSRGAESLQLVVVAGSLIESSKELLQLSQVQIRRFMAHRAMTADNLVRQTATRRAS